MVLVPLQLIKEILVVLLMRHLEAQMHLVGEVVAVVIAGSTFRHPSSFPDLFRFVAIATYDLNRFAFLCSRLSGTS